MTDSAVSEQPREALQAGGSGCGGSIELNRRELVAGTTGVALTAGFDLPAAAATAGGQATAAHPNAAAPAFEVTVHFRINGQPDSLQVDARPLLLASA